MTWEDRVAQVRLHGFTDRQAGFLVTVMLHAGVCLLRHYEAFAHIPHGRKAIDFFQGLVARGYATAHACAHHRARLYHLHHKPLYRAIGEPDNRHRRPTALPRAVERMMVLDGVLADRDRTWLATEREKLAHFTLTHRMPRRDLPSLTFRAGDAETVRYFPDKLPIGLDRSGPYTFMYLLTQDVPIDFRGFLERHAEVFRGLPAWTIRLLVPEHKRMAIPLYAAAFDEQLASPLRPMVVDDLRWYFQARRTGRRDAPERVDQAARAFSAPRFQALYRAWLERGDLVLEASMSATLLDAIARKSGQLECHVLAHRYLHLAPLLGTA
jgi:hypothetical protein